MKTFFKFLAFCTIVAFMVFGGLTACVAQLPGAPPLPANADNSKTYLPAVYTGRNFSVTIQSLFNGLVLSNPSLPSNTTILGNNYDLNTIGLKDDSVTFHGNYYVISVGGGPINFIAAAGINLTGSVNVNNGGSYAVSLLTDNITAHRYLEAPNGDGTIARTSDLADTAIVIRSEMCLKITVSTYAAMMTIFSTSPTMPIDFLVLTDENKANTNTVYQYFPNSAGEATLMWMAATKEF